MTARKPKTLHFWRGDLPHWQVEDGRYFVTIHLQGAIPRVAQERVRSLSAQYQASDDKNDSYLKLSRKIFLEMECWLDRTPAVTHFRQPELCHMVVEAIEHRQKLKTWEMFSFVVMPSHLHLFFELNNTLSLKRQLEEFKRWTGHQAAKINRQLVGCRFWQTEWFDHWSRSDEGDDRITRYIQHNPIKARLATSVGQYPYCK